MKKSCAFKAENKKDGTCFKSEARVIFNVIFPALASAALAKEDCIEEVLDNIPRTANSNVKASITSWMAISSAGVVVAAVATEEAITEVLVGAATEATTKDGHIIMV